MSLSVTPRVWGELMWRSIHMIAISYPLDPDLEARARFRQFFESLQFVLPCKICRAGYTTLFAAMPIDDALDGREELFRWTVDVHNEVAKKLGKPHMSAQFVREKYIFGLETLKEGARPDGKAAGSNGGSNDRMSGLGLTLLLLLCAGLAFVLGMHVASRKKGRAGR